MPYRMDGEMILVMIAQYPLLMASIRLAKVGRAVQSSESHGLEIKCCLRKNVFSIFE